MGPNSLWKMLLPVGLLVGCGPADSPQRKPPEKTVLDPLLQQEQRARDVRNSVDENADKTRKALDAQERGESP